MTRVEYRCSLKKGDNHGTREAIAVDRILPDSKMPQGLEISFCRTIRVPDSGKVQNLPPGLGFFKLYKVHDYASSLPQDMLDKGGVFFPMHQKEALWIKFKANAPFLIKVYCGGVNVVSGEQSDEDAQTKERRLSLAKGGKPIQDYVVVPKQPWIDGVAVKPSVVRQFVAMPIGHGYSVEAQLTGKEVVGGLQFEITPALCDLVDRPVPRGLVDRTVTKSMGSLAIDIKDLTGKTFHLRCSPDDDIKSVMEQIELQAGIPPSRQRLTFKGKRLEGAKTLRNYGIETGSILYLLLQMRGGGGGVPLSEERRRMGIATGGMIKQDIRRDTYDPKKWMRGLTLTIPVQILDNQTFREVTGLEPPPCPIDAETYASIGIAYFDLYEETPTEVSGAEAFSTLRSINELDMARGHTKAPETAVHPRVVRLSDDGNGHIYEIEDPDGLLDPHGARREFRTLAELEAEIRGLNLGLNRN